MKTRKEMLQQFLSEDPADTFSRYALALEWEKEGRDSEAILELEKVVELDPKYVASYYHLGRLLARNGKTDQARAVYTRGLDVASDAGDKRTHSEIQDAIEML